MSQSIKRGILTVVFFCLLFGPSTYWKFARTAPINRKDWTPEMQNDMLGRYGMWLQESSATAGIDFEHQPPKCDARLHHIEPQVAAMGASVSVVDFNRDGWSDLYFTNSRPGTLNALYLNQKDGTFEDIAEAMQVADLNQSGTGACMGSLWADYDNDGFEDLFVYKWGRPELFHNNGGESMTRVTENSGLPEWVNAGTATWFDYDRDGFVDLFIAGYWPDDVRLESLADTRIMPDSFEYASNGGRKYLLRNLGNGTFADVTTEVGLTSTRWSLAVVAADFNDDGNDDLFLANDYGVSELFLNVEDEQGHHFEEIGKESGIGKSPKSGMNAAVGDVLNQGSLAIYETNISENGILIQGNNLWYPTQKGVAKFQNMAAAMGVDLGGWSFGAQFGDLDNDGFLDLYATNGYVSGEPDSSYWYDFSVITGGNRNIIIDADNWPPMRNRSLAGYQRKRLWRNNSGRGSFTDVSQLVGATDTLDGRAVAFADLENRGALDIIVANQRGPALLYRNHVDPDNHWIELELEGTTSNRSAIGTQVSIYWGDNQQQLQQVVSASGYSAENQRRLHFGLGKSENVESIEIHWPSGNRQTIEHPSVDTIHRVREAE